MEALIELASSILAASPEVLNRVQFEARSFRRGSG